MDSNRRFTRHLESKDDYNQSSTNNSFRASTGDSGRGTSTSTERGSTVEDKTTSDASSPLSRDTPLSNNDDNETDNCLDGRSVRVPRTNVFGKKCYQQLFVSHVDNPSAFFLQVAHFQEQYEELHKQINAFYSTNSKPNPLEWNRGDFCIAKFSDNAFYRGRIVEVPKVTKKTGYYDVVFIDYGNWDAVATADIHLLLPRFANLPVQAIACSLTKSLPQGGTWSDHPETIELFKKLISQEFVNATFHLKSASVFWPFNLVDLEISSTKLNVRQHMINKDHIREVYNEEIFKEFNHLLGPHDYIIYNIPHEDEENDDEDRC